MIKIIAALLGLLIIWRLWECGKRVRKKWRDTYGC
jgi:hypothetical protein